MEPLEHRLLLAADVLTGTGGREPDVTVSPLDPTIVAVSSASDGTLQISNDGGQTFPTAVGFQIPPALAGMGYGYAGDPSLDFDSQGTLYWSYLLNRQLDANPAFDLASGEDLTIVVLRINPATGAAIGNAVDLTPNAHVDDKNWLAVDDDPDSPFQGNIYLSWSRLDSGSQVMFTRSVDGGLNYSAPQTVSAGGEGFVWPSHIETAPNGDVYLGYHSDTCGAATAPMFVIRDSTGGANLAAGTVTQKTSFNTAVTCNVQSNPGSIPQTDFWMQGSNAPYIITDPIRPGHIYVVANDDPNDNFGNGDDGDVVLARSTDNGLNWDLSTISHSPPGTLQVMPTGDIDENGDLVVFWYDTQQGQTNPAGNFLLDVYATVSRDGGLTFSNDFQINDVAFDPDQGATIRFNGPPPTRRIGEYNGVDASNGTAYFTWTGNNLGNHATFFDAANLQGAFPDRYEVNNARSTATILGSLPEVTIEGATLHDQVDVDVYKYTANDTGKLLANLFFNDQVADLELEVLDTLGNVIATTPESEITPGLDQEGTIAIPVVSQQEYFLRVRRSTGDVPGNPVVYDLEIENFAAPVPAAVVLDPLDDSGRLDNDNVTSEDQPAVLVQADLSDFAALGISILSAVQAAAGQTAGAAVEVFRNGVSQGFANVVGGSASTLFTFDFGPGDLNEGLNFVTAAVRIFDAQQNASGNPQPADGRTPLSEPLRLRLDTTAPAVPAAPDLLASSDTGEDDTDNVTNKMQPAVAGTAEPNAAIRVLAGGNVVGQGAATSGGAWEITLEPLADGIHQLTVVAEDAAGNVSGVSAPLEIEIDTQAPNTPYLDLVEASDSGRHNDDNITNDDTPLLSATTLDPAAPSHLLANNLRFRIFDRLEESAESVLYDSGVVIGGLTSLNHIFTTANLLAGATIVASLDDGIHNLKLEVEDRAGNISHAFLLDVLIDTVAPEGTARLHPDSDTGIWGIPETLSDGITGDATPSLIGETEANALVRAEIDGEPAGTAVAIPLDGDDAFPPPPEFVGNYRLDTVLVLEDGDHTIQVFFQDVAGNESPADDDATIEITVDTTGPRITNVTFNGTRSVFEPKPSDEGPEPRTGSIFIHFDELPNEEIAAEEGHYQLRGDANGYIRIVEVLVDDVDQTVELVFDAPLYDDRYTLWVSDALSDSAGNPLDGESGATAPFEGNDAPNLTPPTFPTGDGQHGGSFHARFTIDTRPEIATYLGDGTWYVDLNGNGVFDVDNGDPTNRDIVWKFGTKGDLPVTGDWNGDGYDEIGVLGKRGGKDYFFLDLDRNGAFDPTIDAAFEFTMNGAGNGLPIAGDWDGDGSDEVAALQGSSWFIDDSGPAYSPLVTLITPTRINTSMRGLPVAGDWDGDGDDNVGTFDQTVFLLDTDDDFAASELTVSFPEFDFGGLHPQPVAHDWDQDGDDDIGLFVRRETGNNSGAREAGEWFLDVNTDLSGTGTVAARFEPPPTGLPGVPIVDQDIFYNFGDEREPAALGDLRPVVGNFDPPLGVGSPESSQVLRYTNPRNRLDVNGDGTVSPADGLVLINAIDVGGPRELAWPARVTSYLDPNGDGMLAPSDVLAVFNGLNAQVADRAGEGEPHASPILVAPPSPEPAPADAAIPLETRTSSLASPIAAASQGTLQRENRSRELVFAGSESALSPRGRLVDEALETLLDEMLRGNDPT